MSSLTQPTHSTHSPWTPTLSRRLRTYRLEAGYELLKNLRLPMYSVPALAFPWVFYILFGVTFGQRGQMATHLLAGYGAFGVIGAALFGFGVGVAIERGQGWLEIKRASPMPPGAYFVAKIFMSVVFSVLIVAGLSVLAVVFCDVRLPGMSWLALTASLIFGALPFCALGLALSHVCGPNSAPAVVNLIYLPMAFASGLWIPIQMLPGWIQTLAPALPAYHLGQLALAAAGLQVRETPGVAVLALLGFTALGLVGAHLGYRRSEGRTWG